MAEIQKNKAKLAYALQKYHLQKQKQGLKVKSIYEIVNKLFPMTIQTYYNYMSISVSAILKQIDKNELEKYKEDVITSLQRIENETYRDTGSENN